MANIKGVVVLQWLNVQRPALGGTFEQLRDNTARRQGAIDADIKGIIVTAKALFWPGDKLTKVI